MKTGVIVYLTGSDRNSVALNEKTALDDLTIEANRIDLIGPETGHFDVQDAWWSLTAKGMQRIICMVGEMTSAGGIRLTGRRLTLCG